MLPKPPSRVGQIGFLLFPPIRIEGVTIAGEGTAIVIPEYDLCFDIGVCFKPMLSAKYVAITHGHMDHVANLPYYFSQRWFQGMGVGTCVCDKRIEPAVRGMMQGWIDLENQKTSHEVIGLDQHEEIQIKNNLFLRAIRMDHTVPATGYAVIERRTKLKDEFRDLPQSRLMELKREGTDITRELRLPMVTYLGDTLPGPHLFCDEVLKTRILITECTFFEKEHKERAAIGKHVHIDDLVELMPHLECEAIVLTHITRRTNLAQVHEEINRRFSPEDAARIHVLMDHRQNRRRYDQQMVAAEKAAGVGDHGDSADNKNKPQQSASSSVTPSATTTPAPASSGASE